MSRQVIDAVIIAAVLALAATHLYAQGMGNRKVIHPNQPGVVAPGGVLLAPWLAYREYQRRRPEQLPTPAE